MDTKTLTEALFGRHGFQSLATATATAGGGTATATAGGTTATAGGGGTYVYTEPTSSGTASHYVSPVRCHLTLYPSLSLSVLSLSGQ